ncbi:hypothetical protein CapIbe_024211 [Capra ibex]
MRKSLPEPRPVPVCLFTPARSTLPGAPGDSSVDHPYSAETRPAPRLPALHLACFLNTSVEQERTEPARTKVLFRI